MRTSFSPVRLAVAAALALSAGAARAGAFLSIDQALTGARAMTMTLILGDDKLHMTFGPAELIFRGDLGKLWLINSAAHSYTEITPELTAKARAATQAALAAIKGRLAEIPEAERKKVEDMLAGRQPPKRAAPPSYEKTGEARQIGDWSCQPYRVLGMSAPTETCVARLSALGLAPEDVKAFARFGAFAADNADVMRNGAANMNFDALRRALGDDVFPIETKITLDNGARTVVTTLRQARRDDPPLATFELPEGLKRRELPTRFDAPGKP